MSLTHILLLRGLKTKPNITTQVFLWCLIFLNSGKQDSNNWGFHRQNWVNCNNKNQSPFAPRLSVSSHSYMSENTSHQPNLGCRQIIKLFSVTAKFEWAHFPHQYISSLNFYPLFPLSFLVKPAAMIFMIMKIHKSHLLNWFLEPL